MKRQFESITLKELEELIGKEQLSRLFLEHYLMLIGKNNTDVKLDEETKLKDIL